MDEEQDPQSPQAIGPSAPKKPLNAWYYVAAVTIMVMGVAIVLNLVQAMRSGGNQGNPLPKTAGPAETGDFANRGNRSAKGLRKANPEEQKPDVDDSKETSNLLRKHNSSGTQQQGGLSEAAQHRKDALESSSITIDFSEKQEEAKPAQAQPVQAASNAPVADKETEDQQVKPKTLDFDYAGYTGKLHKLLEGTVVETVLENRLEGEFTGPVKTMATVDQWSRNHQTLLFPKGTEFIGEATKVGSQDQERLAVAFHLMQMPDGFPVSLDKFTGLDQIGATALRDKVNHHYLRAFGFSIALGAIGGLAQIGNSTSGFGYDPGVSIRAGISQQLGQESMQILNRLTNPMPTITIRERNRVHIWIGKTLDIPAYANHIIDKDL